MSIIWVRTYGIFVTNPESIATYFDINATPENTVARVTQVLAIILADVMTVRRCHRCVYVLNPGMFCQIYRTFMIWQSNFWVIIIPSLTLIATIGLFRSIHL